MAVMAQPTISIPQVSKQHFLSANRSLWRQGEHVLLLGPTGSGKTTIARDLLTCRDYVCVVAVKRHDETLDLFTHDGYKVISKWPPAYSNHKVIFWYKPQSLSDDLGNQSSAIHSALNAMYLAGGWCIYMDEAGWIAGMLGLGRDVGVLLNQGRSSYISVVCTMTRPSSVVARVPKEALNQPRHKLIFKYHDEKEIKSCADIVGITLPVMRAIMHKLGKHDFLYVAETNLTLVRNTRSQ